MEAECGTSTVGPKDEDPPGGNDIRLWPSIILDPMQGYWLKIGVSTLKHCNERLFSAHTVQQPRKDSNILKCAQFGSSDAKIVIEKLYRITGYDSLPLKGASIASRAEYCV